MPRLPRGCRTDLPTPHIRGTAPRPTDRLSVRSSSSLRENLFQKIRVHVVLLALVDWGGGGPAHELLDMLTVPTDKRDVVIRLRAVVLAAVPRRGSTAVDGSLQFLDGVAVLEPGLHEALSLRRELGGVVLHRLPPVVEHHLDLHIAGSGSGLDSARGFYRISTIAVEEPLILKDLGISHAVVGVFRPVMHPEAVALAPVEPPGLDQGGDERGRVAHPPEPSSYGDVAVTPDVSTPRVCGGPVKEALD